MSLKDYKLLEEIGRGGMGVVHRALAPDGSEVAVKTLRFPSHERTARFEREVRILRELGAGFVPLLDAGTTAEEAFLVMPFLRGGTLRDRLRKGALPVADVISLGRSLAGSLERAHAGGIVHRDMKPENVLFDDGGAPLIADLGLGKHLEPAGGASVALTRSADMRGTPGYVAPEQARSAKDAGPAADVFSLGAILYECLAGFAAFEGANPLELIVKAENENFAPLRASRPEAPAWLVAAVERALRADPEERFADAGELARALEGRHFARKRRALGVTLAALALALSAILAVFLTRGSPAPPTSSVPTGEARPEVDLPELCRAFRGTPHLRLVQVLGSYAWTHRVEPDTVAFSPDGLFAITATKQGAKIFEVPGGRDVRSLATDPTPAVAVALGPRADRALVACFAAKGPGTLRLWTRSGAIDLEPIDAVPAFTIEPGGRNALVGRPDGSLEVRSLDSWSVVSKVPAHDQPITGVACSRDGKRVASASRDGKVVVTEGDRTLVMEGVPGRGEWRVAFSADGESLLAQDPREIRVFEVASGKLVRTLKPGKTAWRGAGFTASGAVFAAGADGTLGPRDGSRLVAQRRGPRACAVSPSGDLALVPFFMTLRLFATDGLREVLPTAGHRGPVAAIAAVDTTTILSAGHDGALELWDLSTGKQIVELVGHAAWIDGVAVSSDRTRAVTAGAGGVVEVWNLATGALERSYMGHEKVGVEAVAISPGGLVATGDRKGGLHVWRLATGERVRMLPVHSDWIHFGSFLDDDRLLTCSQDGKLLVSSVTSGESHALLALDEPITGLGVAPSRGVAVAGTMSGRVFAVDLVGGQPARELVGGHAKAVFCAAVSPGGSLAVTGSGRDARVCLWDLRAGKLLDRIDLASSDDLPFGVTYLPDGTFVVGTFRGVILRFAVR